MARRGAEPRTFADRQDAGGALAILVREHVPATDVVVLGLPRGGVPVAAPVAEALAAPLDVLVVRKLGLPAQPELAMGAVAGVEGEIEVVHNTRVLNSLHVPPEDFARVRDLEIDALQEREHRYRQGAPAVAVEGRTVVLVDDGLATGSTMRAAVAAVRRRRPRRIVVAVPVGASQTVESLAREVDLVLCPEQPPDFTAVGQSYDDFSATSDDEVQALLSAR
jgi:predicted phosphoribosyltransferase